MSHYPLTMLLRAAYTLSLVVSVPCLDAAEPSWIWGSESAGESVIDGLCLFRNDFCVEKAPASAILRITCDDQYVIRINGRLIGVDESWQDIEQYGVKEVLKEGKNRIFVRARNLAKGPAGLLAR